MSARELKVQAYREWSGSSELRYRYHTFDHYWSERYARVYRLPARIAPVPGMERRAQPDGAGKYGCGLTRS
jgi:hypothetical protein